MLSAEANAVLAEQIETLNPSAVLLETKGVAWQLAAYLVTVIKSGAPDLAEMRLHGLGEKVAVEICTAISLRHARKAAALVAMRTMAETLPKPVSAPAPKPAAEEMHGMTALSMAHTLCEMAVSRQAPCLTTLIEDGWSKSTAMELVKVFNAARAAR